MPKKNKQSNNKDLAKEIEDSGVDYELLVEVLKIMKKGDKKEKKKVADVAKEEIVYDDSYDDIYEDIVEHFSNTEEEDLPWEGGWTNSDNLDRWIDEHWDIENNQERR